MRELLRGAEAEIPEYDEVQLGSSDLSDLRPAEYRADLVLFLVRAQRKVLGVIVEIQLACDGDKPYSWPAYIANLRAKHRCPVGLLVVTIDFDLILIALSQTAPEVLKASMNSLGYEYQSDFARRYFFEGKTEGAWK